MSNPILVYRFDDAPEEYRKMSEHGGDEDWLAIVPASLADDDIWWAETGTPFGCCHVSQDRLADGRRVLIGAHA